MSTNLGNVTLLSGSGKEYAGALYDEPAGLTFRAHNGEYLNIPWENMSQWGWNLCNQGGLKNLLATVCVPLMVVTGGYWDPSTYVYISIRYTDPDLFVEQAAVYKLGGPIHEGRAKRLVEEITTLRASHLRDRHQRTSIYYR